MGTCPITGGEVHVGDLVAQQAFDDFVDKYAALAIEECDETLVGTLAGITLSPGVYCFDAAAAGLTGVLTLNGDSTETWLFKTGTNGANTGDLEGTNFSVVMTSGETCSNNVTWRVDRDAALTTSDFLGSILAGRAISVTGGSVDGRAMATTAVTLTNTVVSVCAVVEPPINAAPTLDPIAVPAPILEDAGPQTVALTGIGSGAVDEVQTLVVTATSGNLALIPDPTVTYVTPAATGSLSYTPVPNANGSALITVTVKDDGGTANGGVDTFQRTFTVTVIAVDDPAPPPAGDSDDEPPTTPTPAPTLTPTLTPTPTPTPTSTPTPTPVPGGGAVLPTPTPAATAPAATATPAPTVAPVPAPTATAAPTVPAALPVAPTPGVGPTPQPAAVPVTTTPGGGISPWVWVVAGLAAVALIAGGYMVARRRRGAAA
jgi:hypothetical protein